MTTTPPITLDLEELVDTATAARLIGLAAGTLRTLRSREPESMPPSYRIRGRRLYLVRDLLAWREQRRVDLSQQAEATE